jgi:hypothetical protein
LTPTSSGHGQAETPEAVFLCRPTGRRRRSKSSRSRYMFDKMIKEITATLKCPLGENVSQQDNG